MSVRSVFGRWNVSIVDIVGNRKLEDEYLFRIPVLLYRGTVIAEGRIDRSSAKVAMRTAVNLGRLEGQHG